MGQPIWDIVGFVAKSFVVFVTFVACTGFLFSRMRARRTAEPYVRLREISEHEQFASPMRPTRRFDNRTGFAPLVVQVVEPGIRICLKNAGVASKMVARMLPTAIG